MNQSDQSLDIKILNEKLDTLTLKVEKIHSILLKISDVADERKEMLEKSKSTINNIHRVFGGQRMSVDLSNIFAGAFSGEDDSDDDVQPSILAIEDSDNPFN